MPRSKWMRIIQSILIFALSVPVASILLFDGRDVLAATPLSILPNNVCEERHEDEINVCGGRIKRQDIIDLQSLADCLVKWERTSSRTALARYMTKGDPSLFRWLFASDHSCQSYRSVRASPILLGGAFAKALLDAPAATDRSFDPAEGREPTETGDNAMDCLMRTGRADAYAFVTSLPYTKKEAANPSAVIVKLGHCLPDGEEIRISTAVFRSAVAIRLLTERRAASSPRDSTELIAGPPIRVVTKPLALPIPPLSELTMGNQLYLPVLTMKKQGAEAEPSFIPGYRHRTPDLAEKQNPEDEMAKNAQPAIDPSTGEPVDERAKSGERGSPY